MRRTYFILILLFSQQLFAQELAKFSLTVEKDKIDAPVAIALNEINYNTDVGNIELYELTPKGSKLIPTQLENGHSTLLWFVLEGTTQEGTVRNFILKRGNQTLAQDNTLSLKKDDKDLALFYKDSPILKYRYAITPAPEEADPLYQRSAYIHPLFSPDGEMLTRIQAPDHYHHYGIWGPWTKTHIDNREVDFWNLKKGQGTVQFKAFLSEETGAIYNGFKALQQHIDFGATDKNMVALNEILDVRAWNIGNGVYMVDYTTTLNSPLPKGIMLNAYRYGGGIGWRATEKWTKDNCTVLTSEGKTRADADGSKAKWCLVEGESKAKEGRSGILFLSHPANRMHPEPMRVWPLNANNGRGDMYFEFVPIRYHDWKIEAKKSYTLKYRMIIFDGKLDARTAEKYWNSFASNPKVRFE